MFFVIAIVAITVLVIILAMSRARHRRIWRQVFETNSRSDGVAHEIDRELRRNNVRTKLIYKGPPNSPVIGMSGEQIIAVEVHIEDMERARPIVSKVLNEDWRGRF